MFVETEPEEWSVERPNATSITVKAEDFTSQGTRIVVLNYQ